MLHDLILEFNMVNLSFFYLVVQLEVTTSLPCSYYQEAIVDFVFLIHII